MCSSFGTDASHTEWFVMSDIDTWSTVVSPWWKGRLASLSQDFFSVDNCSPFPSCLLLISTYTTRFRIPPIFEKVVTKWKIGCGTLGVASPQMPYNAIAHHCTKKAATNMDIARAARCEALILADILPSDSRTSTVCWWIRYHVRRYNTMFMKRIRRRGTVVNKRFAILPFTPSK